MICGVFILDDAEELEEELEEEDDEDKKEPN